MTTPTTNTGRAQHDLAWGDWCACADSWANGHAADRESCQTCAAIIAIEQEAVAAYRAALMPFANLDDEGLDRSAVGLATAGGTITWAMLDNARALIGRDAPPRWGEDVYENECLCGALPGQVHATDCDEQRRPKGEPG